MALALISKVSIALLSPSRVQSADQAMRLQLLMLTMALLDALLKQQPWMLIVAGLQVQVLGRVVWLSAKGRQWRQVSVCVHVRQRR